MWPFTISTSARGGGRSYTLCAGTEQGRAAWKDKIESAQILRRFDLESNRVSLGDRLVVETSADSDVDLC